MEKGKCVWGSASISRPAIVTEDRLSIVHRVCLGLFLWFERCCRVVGLERGGSLDETCRTCHVARRSLDAGRCNLGQ